MPRTPTLYSPLYGPSPPQGIMAAEERRLQAVYDALAAGQPKKAIKAAENAAKVRPTPISAHVK